jgi:hypothetical protein
MVMTYSMHMLQMFTCLGLNQLVDFNRQQVDSNVVNIINLYALVQVTFFHHKSFQIWQAKESPNSHFV